MESVRELNDRQLLEELLIGIKQLTAEEASYYVTEYRAAKALGMRPRDLRKSVVNKIDHFKKIKTRGKNPRDFNYRSEDIINHKLYNSTEIRTFHAASFSMDNLIKLVRTMNDRQLLEEITIALKQLTSVEGDNYISEDRAAETLGITPRTLRKGVIAGKAEYGRIRFYSATARHYEYHAGDVLKLKLCRDERRR